MNPYRQLGGQTLIYGMGNVIPRILNYAIMTFYYTRKFSVENYGIITELYAYVSIMLVILTYGMETGLFRFSSEKGRDKQTVFHTAATSVIATSLLFLIFIIMFHKTIAGWMGYAGNPEYIIYMGGILSADAIAAIVFAKLRIENKVRRFATLKIINVIVTIFLVIFLLEAIPRLEIINRTAYYKETLSKIGIGYILIANLLASILILLLLLKEFATYKLKVKLGLLGNMLRYSLPLLAAGLAGMVNETLDRILLRRFVAPPLQPLYELGIFGANYRIAVLMTLFVQMFRYAAEPFFFNKMKSKDAKIIYADVLKYFTIFMMIIFLVVTLYLDVFKYFIDEKYHEGLKIVPIVLFANILVGLLFNVNMWYKLTGKTLYGVLITASGAFITIVLNVLLIPLYSYTAAAWVHIASNFTMLMITYYFGRKLYKVDYDIERIVIYIGLGLLLYGISVLIKSEIIWLNMLCGSTILLIYLLYCNRKENLLGIFVAKNEGEDKEYI